MFPLTTKIPSFSRRRYTQSRPYVCYVCRLQAVRWHHWWVGDCDVRYGNGHLGWHQCRNMIHHTVRHVTGPMSWHQGHNKITMSGNDPRRIQVHLLWTASLLLVVGCCTSSRLRLPGTTRFDPMPAGLLYPPWFMGEAGKQIKPCIEDLGRFHLSARICAAHACVFLGISDTSVGEGRVFFFSYSR